MLPDDDKRYAIETCRSSESVSFIRLAFFSLYVVATILFLYMALQLTVRDLACKVTRAVMQGNMSQAVCTDYEVMDKFCN